MWSCVIVIKLISVPAEATNSVYMNLGFKPTMGSRLCAIFICCKLIWITVILLFCLEIILL